MTEPTLKPCPRCGGVAKFGNTKTEWFPYCSMCGMGRTYAYGFNKPSDAATWWNERPGEQRFDSQLDYSIALGRAIEHHCRMVEVPESIAKECPHHAAMLNDHLGRVSRKPEPEPEPTRNAAEPPHQCPYGGLSPHRVYVDDTRLPCGVDGYLCDRCQLDAHKRMVRALVRAIVPNKSTAEWIFTEEGLL